MKRFFRISFVFVSLLIIAGVTIWLHCIEPQLAWSELIKIITGGLVIISLSYSILAFEETRKKNQNDARVVKFSTTYQAMKEWYTPDMIDHFKIISEFSLKTEFLVINISLDDFNVYYDNEVDFKKSFTIVMNYFETISIAVQEGLMDDEFTKKYCKKPFIDFYNTYNSFIDYRRIKRNNPSLWLGFTEIAKKWNN